ncbi:MAG: WD40/YVTN/BNR-like repeat-containing protein, partial [Betaproteobacteria bacterium]
GSRRAHDVLTVGASDLSAFAGINGGGGVVPGPDATGFVLSDLELALVIATEREAVQQVLSGPIAWTDVAISGTSKVGAQTLPAIQVAVAGGAAGRVYLSDDQGVRWRDAGAPRGDYRAVSISSDGNMIAAVMANGFVVTSTDRGESWGLASAAGAPYTDVALLSRDRIAVTDTFEAVRFDVLEISGRFVPGDVIGLRIMGQSTESFQVPVPQRSASSAPPSQSQLNASLAASLRAQINAKSTSVRAMGSGSQIILEARDVSAGWAAVDPWTLQGQVDPVSKSTLFGWTVVNEPRTNFGNFDRATLGNTEFALLTGRFAIGDVLRVTGFADEAVAYTVTAADLIVSNGKGGFQIGTPEQVRANIAAGLARLLGAQTTATAVVAQSGPMLSFTGETGRPAIRVALDADIDSRGNRLGSGGVEQANATTYRDAMGAVSVGDSSVTTGFIDTLAPRADARFTSIDTFNAGTSMFAAAGDPVSGVWQSGDPGLFIGNIAPARTSPAVVQSITPIKGASPPGEGVDSLLDGNSTTKYLSLAGPGSGFVITLDQPDAFNSLTLISRTNDDNWQWDPKSFKVLGSNDTGAGSGAWPLGTWTEIASGATGLANARGSVSQVGFANNTAYRHYAVVFTETKGSVAGKSYLLLAEARLGRTAPMPVPEALGMSTAASPGVSPANQGIGNVNDRNPSTKYLNQAGADSGLTLSFDTPEAFNALRLVAAKDGPAQWDPKTWRVLGSNVSASWTEAVWTELGSGDTLLADARGSSSVVMFDNTTPYTHYAIVFPEVKGVSGGKSYLQIAEAQLFRAPLGSPGGSPVDQAVDKATDGNLGTNYLNFEANGSGYAVTLARPEALDTLLLVSRLTNPLWPWDPSTWEVYGSNSAQAFTDEGWELLGSGQTGLADTQGSSTLLNFGNDEAWRSYKVVFPSVKGGMPGLEAAQIAEAQLLRSAVPASLSPMAGDQVVWTDITRNAPADAAWAAVAASEDGHTLVAAAKGGQIWVAKTPSDDWAWVATQSPRAWTSVALSANGRVIAAAAEGTGGGIWVSEDGGASWRMVLETGARAWRSVALSSDGSPLIAAADGEGVFTARLAVAGASLSTRVAVEAEAGSVAVVGVSGLTLEVRDATVKVNLADKSTGRVIDFAAGDVNVTTGTDRSRTMTIDGADQEMLSVTASFTIEIGDYVYLDGSAGFEKRTDTVTIADGSTVKVDALAIGAAEINAFAGLNGPYRIDADTVNANAVGVSMTDVNVGLGLFTAQPGQKDKAGNSLNGVRWTALSADAGAVELVGMPGVTLAARSFEVELNRVSGLPAGVPADAHVIDFRGDNAYPIRTGTGSTIDLSMSSELGQLLRVRGDVDVSLAGMLSLSGGIQLEQYQRTVTLTDASDEQQVIEVMTGAVPGANWYRMVIEIDGERYLTRDIHVTETAQQIENAINAAIDTVPGAQVTVATEADGDRPVVRFGGSLAGTDIKPIKLVVPSYGAAWSAAGTVTTLVEGGETQEVLARMLVLAGADVSARIATGSGDNALGLELTDLDFALAFADSVDDDRSFLALKGSAASLGVVGLERYGLALMGSNRAVNLNLGFGDDPQGGRNTNTINWEATPLTLKPGTGTPITLAFTDEVLEVGGSMLVRVGDFLRVEGTVVVSRKTLDVSVAGRTEFVQGFLIGASDVSAQVQGIQVEGLNLAAALLRPLDAPDFDKRAWLSVRAEVDTVSVSAEMLGLPAELFTLEANSLLFETNRAIGSRAGVANDAVVDFSVTELDGETIDRSLAVKTSLVTDATMSLDYGVDAGQFTTITLDAALSIADYVTASGSFALSMLGGRTVTLSDGQRRSMRTTLIAARNVDVRLGVNAGSEEDFIGVSLTGGSLGLALLSDVRGGGSFVGLHAGAQSVALEGVPGLTLS